MAGEAIFIGYRRDDTADVAGRIYDALAGRFGRARLFKDVDNLRPGADFGAYIQTVLPRCRVALILIGEKWIDARDEGGHRRIDDPNDWVRIEIEIALATPGLDVVPVLVNGARMPRAEEVPQSLLPLLRRHAAIVRRDPDFQGDLAKLIVALRASVRTGVLDLPAFGDAANAPAEPPRRAFPAWGLLAGAGALVLAGVLIWSPWRSGVQPNEPNDSAQAAHEQIARGQPGGSPDPEIRSAASTQTYAANRQAPELLSPAAGAVGHENPAWIIFRWAPVEGARSYALDVDCFHCCVENRWCSDVNQNWLQQRDISQPEFAHQWVGNNRGRWRVWAVFPDGSTTERSEWREFGWSS